MAVVTPNTFDWPTFTAAAVAALTGVAALIWKIVEHRSAKPDVQLELVYSLTAWKAGDPMRPLLTVWAINRGGATVSARKWSFGFNVAPSSKFANRDGVTVNTRYTIPPDGPDTDDFPINLVGSEKGHRGAEWSVFARALPGYVLDANKTKPIKIRCYVTVDHQREPLASNEIEVGIADLLWSPDSDLGSAATR
jgi:hypothetical protein